MFFVVTGELLPIQAIYGGRTDRSLPAPGVRAAAEEAGFGYTITISHWATKESYQRFIKQIIIPDYEKTCERLGRKAREQKLILQVNFCAQ